MTRKKVSTPTTRAKGGARSLIMYRSRILSMPLHCTMAPCPPRPSSDWPSSSSLAPPLGPRPLRRGVAPAGDRIERFREIAVARLSVVEDTGGALDPASQVEIDALLDA